MSKGLLAMAYEIDCMILPKKGFHFDIIGNSNIFLPNKQEVILGRGVQYGIKDLGCSKKQLTLEADVSSRLVRARSIGRNPSILAGFPMEQNHDYFVREGMAIQISPEVEFTIKFENKQEGSNKTPASNKFNWSASSGTFLVCSVGEIIDGPVCKIAGFDLDWTLITTKTGYTFPSNDDDWKIWHSDIIVKQRLKTLTKERFNLVMFTNQVQLDTLPRHRKESFKKKIENIVTALDVPFTVLISTSSDKFRKPAPGMWEYFASKLKGDICMESSFYVGDAAGRIAISKPKISADFDITDRLFARNVGVKFYTPEEFFLNELPREFKDVSFHPQQMPTDNYPDLKFPTEESEVIVMVGSPASGKSYFARTILETRGYKRISRDELKAMNKCRDKLINYISQQKNVVYDATNPDKESRKHILDICAQQGFKNIRCFVMTTSEDRCLHNNKFRQVVGSGDSSAVPFSALAIFNKKFEQPTVEEGFKSIIEIPFVPKFQCKDHEQLYTKYLQGSKKRKK